MTFSETGMNLDMAMIMLETLIEEGDKSLVAMHRVMLKGAKAVLQDVKRSWIGNYEPNLWERQNDQ